MNTPGLFEPPVRSLRATIPDAESHQQYYSTVLLIRASTAYNFCGKQASPLPTAGLPRRLCLGASWSEGRAKQQVFDHIYSVREGFEPLRCLRGTLIDSLDRR